jgi:hypothetical protein
MILMLVSVYSDSHGMLGNLKELPLAGGHNKSSVQHEKHHAI